MEKKADEENKQFPFAKLVEHKPEIWANIVEFFGIDISKFPSEYLAFQQETHRNIVLLN